MANKPNLTALRGSDANAVQLAALFRELTGREPTAQEMAEARAELAQPESTELPQAHFGTVKETPPNFRTQEPEPDPDDEQLDETPGDVVAMLGFDPLDADD